MSESGTAPVAFGDRLQAVFDDLGQLCVGIDPHPYLLEQWGLPDSAEGLRSFGLTVVEASAGVVGIVKPQVAFFERHGSAGVAALEEILATARSAGLIVIADAKRGDLGSSVEAYGQAWLTPGNPLEADAVTLNPYQGVGSLEAPMSLALEHGKGVFILAATSNPEGRALQLGTVASGETVASSIVKNVTGWNSARTVGAHGSMGLVLGATVDFSEYGIDLDSLASSPTTPVLAPGFGHQGAEFSQLTSLYGAASRLAVVSASRSILNAGQSGLSVAITRQAAEVRECRE